MPERYEPCDSENVLRSVKDKSEVGATNFRQLSTLELLTNAHPTLRMLKTLKTEEYIKRGYIFGLMSGGQYNYYDTGSLAFSPDLTRLTTIGKRRVGNMVWFEGGDTQKFHMNECWFLGKQKIRKDIVVISRLNPALPTTLNDRGDTDCFICKEDMTGQTLFTCPNRHQSHLTCWNNWTQNQTTHMECCLCKVKITRALNIGKTYLRTEFQFGSAKHTTADLIAHKILHSASQLRGQMITATLIDTAYAFNTDLHLTDFYPAVPNDPLRHTPYGVLRVPTETDPYWVALLTYFRSPENFERLRYGKFQIYHYDEDIYLADLRLTYPDTAFDKLQEVAGNPTAKEMMKIETYIRHRVMTKSNADLIKLVCDGLMALENSGSEYEQYIRRILDLPAEA